MQCAHLRFLRLGVVFQGAGKLLQALLTGLVQLPCQIALQLLHVLHALAHACVAGHDFAHQLDERVQLVQAHAHCLQRFQARGGGGVGGLRGSGWGSWGGFCDSGCFEIRSCRRLIWIVFRGIFF